MLKAFRDFIRREKLFSYHDRILLAVSGGVDSAVMCDLFRRAGFRLGIAHCNFMLRGKESEDDEKFVRLLAKKYGVPFFGKKFKTADYAQQEGCSVQMAARQLRYEWLEETRNKNKFSFIATAHHGNDSVETLILNLVRGTGIAGLHGILPWRGHIIRPLLFAGREEIECYARESNIAFREDSSNSSGKYLRNKIRHEVIPVLKEINPSLEETFQRNIERIREAEKIFKIFIEEQRKRLVITEKNRSLISLEALKAAEPLQTILFEILRPFGFNEKQVRDVVQALPGIAGKKFYSSSFRLLKDRKHLIIEPAGKGKEKSAVYAINKNTDVLDAGDTRFFFAHKAPPFAGKISKDARTACLDGALLKFPLMLRKWKPGDSFYPLGMKKRKKISDFFIDSKISLGEKEKVWILTTGKEIVWVAGQRIDERFKITPKTGKMYMVRMKDGIG